MARVTCIFPLLARHSYFRIMSAPDAGLRGKGRTPWSALFVSRKVKIGHACTRTGNIQDIRHQFPLCACSSTPPLRRKRGSDTRRIHDRSQITLGEVQTHLAVTSALSPSITGTGAGTSTGGTARAASRRAVATCRPLRPSAATPPCARCRCAFATTFEPITAASSTRPNLV